MFLRLLLCLLVALPVFAEDSAVLEVTLRDEQGAAVGGCAEFTNASKDVRVTKCAVAGDSITARMLPAGTYAIRATSPGFAQYAATVDLRRGDRKSLVIAFYIAAVTSEVRVTADNTLLDATGASGQRLASETIAQFPAALPGRDLITAVQTQPGWVLEANGALHPRGSEYDTLFVIDGLPITTNRSPAFAPETTLNEIDALEVMTSGYPAEYGRHLGGVVEVATAASLIEGVHGQLEMQQASFATTSGSGSLSYAGKRTGVSTSLSGFTTDRYLDPPSEANLTNNALGHSFTARVDRELGSSDSLRFWFANSATRFQVPNENLQQISGQQQNRDIAESAGYVSYDRSLSSNSLLSARLMVRDASAKLVSNAESTPIQPQQDGGLRDEYLSVTLSSQRGRHEIKAGAQFSRTQLHEQFSYVLTAPAVFDEDLPLQFAFSSRRGGHTEAGFVQDRFRFGRWTLSAGVRWDRYSLLAQDSAFSPRVSVAYHAVPWNLVLHASYDRAFEEPPIENLLLASSTSVLRLSREAAQLPVPLSRGDFGEAGLSKLFGERLRIDAKAFIRNTRNFIDDDVLLNTGVGLPFSFARASIYGGEVKLDMPHWGRFGGFASYSYLLGRSMTPVTGGLFLEKDAGKLLVPGNVFPISQDQRNTVSGLLRFAITKSLWTATTLSYASGLPTEIDTGLSRADLVAQFSNRIVDQIDLARGRTKPNYTVDWSIGWKPWQQENKSIKLQLDVCNLTNKLNVINFAGLFSGTALGSPRAAALRAAFTF